MWLSHFYVITVTKELNLDYHLSKQDDNNTHVFIDNKTKDQIIKEHKLYLSKHKINLANYMQDLSVMLWIPEMHKNPITFGFITASPVCSSKALSKDITSSFKLFYEKVERYAKRKWSVIKIFWTIQNNYSVVSSINKLNICKAAKSMSTFGFQHFGVKC